MRAKCKFVESTEMEKLHKEIINIWDKYNISERVPLFYPDLKQQSILFVGLNPSFSLKGFNKSLKGTEYERKLNRLDEFYSYKNLKKDKIKDYQKIEMYSREKHPYFNRFREISKEINIDWEHIDLLLIRNTNQKEVEKLIKSNKDFFDKQIELMIDFVKRQLNPIAIIVENAFASKLIQAEINLDFDNNYGTYLTDKKVPIFYSGM